MDDMAIGMKSRRWRNGALIPRTAQPDAVAPLRLPP